MSEDPDRPIRVLICDDHAAVGDAVGFVIEHAPGLELVAPPVRDPHEAIRLAQELHPDVVVMDVELHASLDGFETTRRLRQEAGDPSVIIFTASQDVALLVDAVEAGAAGIIRKDEPVASIVSAVVAAARGEILVDAATLAPLLRDVAARRADTRAADRFLQRLTDREREILQLLARGSNNDQMASALFISPSTVQTHVRNIMAKLEVGSRLEAVVLAARHGVVTVG